MDEFKNIDDQCKGMGAKIAEFQKLQEFPLLIEAQNYLTDYDLLHDFEMQFFIGTFAIFAICTKYSN